MTNTAVAEISAETDPLSPERLRHVFGHYPTGVVIATAFHEGEPVGMSVGSFTSVSLDPPLIAFMPDRRSSSFPSIRASGSFSINVLGSDQEAACRSFAKRGSDKFADLPWTPAKESGSPILDGVVAWIDCDIERVVEAGDHYIVIGRVLELSVASDKSPLLFLQGKYGAFQPREYPPISVATA